MGKEMPSQSRGEPISPKEHLGINHFYAAYVYDDPAMHPSDVSTLIEAASKLGYSMRYWWLSSAMEIGEEPDRLIVCVHHPSNAEDAGVDLYEELQQREVAYTDLEAANLGEYVQYGMALQKAQDIRFPTGEQLFPDLLPNGEPDVDRLGMTELDHVLSVTVGDIQSMALGALGRLLTDAELSSIAYALQEHLDYTLMPLLTRLEDSPVIPAEGNGEETDYLVLYTLSGYATAKASSQQAANDVVVGGLLRMLGQHINESATVIDARKPPLQGLAIDIESVESIPIARESE